MTTIRALGYVRQSVGKEGETRDDALSLDAQESAIRRHCIQHEWQLIDVVRDHDVSGSRWDRPGMKQLLDVADSGEIDTVIVYKLSRFARDAFYQELTFRELKARGVNLVSVTEQGADKTLVRLIVGAVNQHHNEELSQWIGDMIQQRAARGLHHGEPPYGYRSVLDGKKRRHIPQEDEADIVRRIFAMRADGNGSWKIACALNDEGVPSPSGGKWSQSGVHRVYRNATYAGYAVHKGEIVTDLDPNHMTALIDRDLWERVSRMGRNRERWFHEKDYSSWLEGLVRHDCGAKMVLAPRKQVRGGTIFICSRTPKAKPVNCRLKPTSIVTHALDRAVRMCLSRDLDQRITDPDAAIREHLRSISTPGAINQRTFLEKRRDKVRAAMTRAEDLVLDGLRDRAWFAQKTAEQMAELQEIETALAELGDLPSRDDVARAMSAIADAGTAIELASEETLRAALTMLGTVRFGANGCTIVYHPEYRYAIPQPAVVAIEIKTSGNHGFSYIN